MKCDKCGKKMSIMSVMSKDLSSEESICIECKEQVQVELRQTQARKRAEDQEKERQRRELAKSVVVSTTPRLEGWAITEYLGIESVEFVIGTGPMSELISDFQDLFDARSSPFEKRLQTAKQSAFETLKYRAAQKGGNAVVGVDLDYIDFTGNRIGLIVNGTVVRIVRSDNEE
jgi:uncharacterized protein YbjQ (UPF0145 family)